MRDKHFGSGESAGKAQKIKCERKVKDGGMEPSGGGRKEASEEPGKKPQELASGLAGMSGQCTVTVI